MTRHQLRITYKARVAPETRTIFASLSESVLEGRLLARAPNIASIEFEIPEGEVAPPKVGDVVQVEDGRYSGCILTLLAITPGHTFVCENQYGTPSLTHPGKNVIHTKAVQVYRRGGVGTGT